MEVFKLPLSKYEVTLEIRRKINRNTSHEVEREKTITWKVFFLYNRIKSSWKQKINWRLIKVLPRSIWKPFFWKLEKKDSRLKSLNKTSLRKNPCVLFKMRDERENDEAERPAGLLVVLSKSESDYYDPSSPSSSLLIPGKCRNKWEITVDR